MTAPTQPAPAPGGPAGTALAPPGPTTLARGAGALYLLMVVFGGYAHLGVRAHLHVPGDAAATAGNLVADPALFRSALVADLVMATAFVALGAVLLVLLRDVDRQVATALFVLVAVGAAMIVANLLLHQAALLVATDPAYTALRSDELVLLLVDLHVHGYTLAGVLFGLWLLPLAWLTHRAHLLPRPLSVLLAIAGVAWIVDTVVAVAAPGLPEVVHTVLQLPTWAELWLIAYLLTVGVRAPRTASSSVTSTPS